MKKNLPVPVVVGILVVLAVGLFIYYQSYSSDHVFTGTKTGRSKSDPPPLGPPPAPPMPSGMQQPGGATQ